MVSGGFLKECVQTCLECLCIQQLHNGVWRIPQGMCPDMSRMSLHTTTEQWCLKDSSRNLSGHVQFGYNNYTMVFGGFLRECVRDVFTYNYTMASGGFLRECVRDVFAYNNWRVVSQGFLKEFVWTCPGCHCIQQLHNGVWRIPQRVCPDKYNYTIVPGRCVGTGTGCFFFEIYNLWWFLVASMTTYLVWFITAYSHLMLDKSLDIYCSCIYWLQMTL